MLRFRGLTLWVSCALLIASFMAAEELAGAGAKDSSRHASVPRTLLENDSLTALLPGEPKIEPATALIPISSKESATPSEQNSGTRYRICRVTAYCDRGLTASGVPAGLGQCAAPADIPLGSRVYIPALGRAFMVTDRTHRRFRHNTVDIFISSRQACRQFGRKYLECEFAIIAHPPAYGQVQVHP
ncbi:MAG: 3D domain-containing protein [Planctomycetota bacterium]